MYSLMELSWSVPLQRQRDKIAEICYQRAGVPRSASEGSDEVPPRYVGRSLCCAATGVRSISDSARPLEVRARVRAGSACVDE